MALHRKTSVLLFQICVSMDEYNNNKTVLVNLWHNHPFQHPSPHSPLQPTRLQDCVVRIQSGAYSRKSPNREPRERPGTEKPIAWWALRDQPKSQWVRRTRQDLPPFSNMSPKHASRAPFCNAVLEPATVVATGVFF